MPKYPPSGARIQLSPDTWPRTAPCHAAAHSGASLRMVAAPLAAPAGAASPRHGSRGLARAAPRLVSASPHARKAAGPVAPGCG